MNDAYGEYLPAVLRFCPSRWELIERLKNLRQDTGYSTGIGRKSTQMFVEFSYLPRIH